VPDRPQSRRALLATIAALIAASAALAGAASLGWAQLEVHTPLRGTIGVRLAGSDVLAALGPLAAFAIAAVAAVLATGGLLRWLLGALLLGAAVPPAVAVFRVFDSHWLTSLALSAAQRPALSVPLGPATVVFAGPVLAAVGAGLLAAAGITLITCGHRMPRLGRRYQIPAARTAGSVPPDGGRLWERLDAGEDPTAPPTPPVR
jgi:hypothetical protein